MQLLKTLPSISVCLVISRDISKFCSEADHIKKTFQIGKAKIGLSVQKASTSWITAGGKERGEGAKK